MRLLHTSDWHLGRSFHGVDLLSAQATFLDHLVEVVRSESVDAVLVSGDLYDRALPSADAVALCDDGLSRLAGTGAQLVVISGNHDSATRLGWGSRLLSHSGVHMRCDVAFAGSPVLLSDSSGEVAIYAVPYLEPHAVRDLLQAPEPVGHASVLRAALSRVRDDLSRRAGARSVVVAHAFVVGGQGCASERDIGMGGVGSVPISLFDGVDYAALGHLHRQQSLSSTVRYSGSPLPFSFSEAGQSKGSWLVELPGGRPALARSVPAPVPRPLSVLRGTLDELLTSPAHCGVERHFLAITLTDVARPLDAMARLRTRFPHAVCLEFAPEGRVCDHDSYAVAVRASCDTDIVTAFVAHTRGTPANDDELELFASGFAAGRLAEVTS
ncbi:MAG: exonuclease SbcCD subunit D [Frankiaceae bacterium]